MIVMRPPNARSVPHPNLTAEDCIHRLCLLQEEVSDVINARSHMAMDCFCGRWRNGTPRPPTSYFRNYGAGIEFIERAVRAALVQEAEARRVVEAEAEERLQSALSLR